MREPAPPDKEIAKALFDEMMAAMSRPFGWNTEKVIMGAARRLAGCDFFDAEDAAAYLAYDKGVSLADAARMQS